jgi:hypothetical protein
MHCCVVKHNYNSVRVGKLSFMLDVHKLRVLREVAAQGSFSAAATQLYFSPSAFHSTSQPWRSRPARNL